MSDAQTLNLVLSIAGFLSTSLVAVLVWVAVKTLHRINTLSTRVHKLCQVATAAALALNLEVDTDFYS